MGRKAVAVKGKAKPAPKAQARPAGKAAKQLELVAVEPAARKVARSTPPPARASRRPPPAPALELEPAPELLPPTSPERERGPKRRATAEQMATKQREISISEFFTKNRHLLGFDNPSKALLTTIKEAVDNSLDACEEAGILPEITIEVRDLALDAKGGGDLTKGEGRFVVVIEDNGPGIVKAQVPKIFGKLLYGSKFHRLKQSRGQQGIGISAAAMYGQLTTGQPIRVTSRIGKAKPAHYFEIQIDTRKNDPVVDLDLEVVGRLRLADARGDADRQGEAGPLLRDPDRHPEERSGGLEGRPARRVAPGARDPGRARDRRELAGRAAVREPLRRAHGPLEPSLHAPLRAAAAGADLVPARDRGAAQGGGGDQAAPARRRARRAHAHGGGVEEPRREGLPPVRLLARVGLRRGRDRGARGAQGEGPAAQPRRGPRARREAAQGDRRDEEHEPADELPVAHRRRADEARAHLVPERHRDRGAGAGRAARPRLRREEEGLEEGEGRAGAGAGGARRAARGGRREDQGAQLLHRDRHASAQGLPRQSVPGGGRARLRRLLAGGQDDRAQIGRA